MQDVCIFYYLTGKLDIIMPALEQKFRLSLYNKTDNNYSYLFENEIHKNNFISLEGFKLLKDGYKTNEVNIPELIINDKFVNIEDFLKKIEENGWEIPIGFEFTWSNEIYFHKNVGKSTTLEFKLITDEILKKELEEIKNAHGLEFDKNDSSHIKAYKGRIITATTTYLKKITENKIINIEKKPELDLDNKSIKFFFIIDEFISCTLTTYLN